ncbi:hypothetical protein P9112_002900 [Eukaryota sp. TZLM1-RC]
MVYILPSELAKHNHRDSAWVCIFGSVLDITPLIHQEPPLLTASLLGAAGSDISHWFNKTSFGFRTYTHPDTLKTVPLTPDQLWMLHLHDSTGKLLEQPHPNPWWKNQDLMIGQLTSRSRHVNFFNMLTHDRTTLEVAAEETLIDIARRLFLHNSHCLSYTWKHCGKELDMEKTLDGNGIEDIELVFSEASLPSEEAIPCICLYFNDDLTVA